MDTDRKLDQLSFWGAACIYLHADRWHEFRTKMNVPFVSERVVELSGVAEGAVGGGLLGFLSGSSKLTGGRKTTKKITVIEQELIDEACRKAVLSQPPEIFVITDASDWEVAVPGQIVLANGIFKLCNRERWADDETPNTNMNYDAQGECYGRKVKLRFSGSRVRASSGWYALWEGRAIPMACIGRVIADRSDSVSKVIEPIMMGLVPFPWESGRT